MVMVLTVSKGGFVNSCTTLTVFLSTGSRSVATWTRPVRQMHVNGEVDSLWLGQTQVYTMQEEAGPLPSPSCTSSNAEIPCGCV